jgi:hypothetical protein
VIEAIDTTILLHPGQTGRVDGWTSVVLERGAR